jgi:hypothetical protein
VGSEQEVNSFRVFLTTLHYFILTTRLSAFFEEASEPGCSSLVSAGDGGFSTQLTTRVGSLEPAIGRYRGRL